MVFGLLIVSTIIFAQGKVNPTERAAKQADRMKTALELDDVQYKGVKAINEEYDSKWFQVRSDSSLSTDARKQKMKALHSEKNDAIKKVLTEEQNTKWASLRKAKEHRHRAHAKKSQGDHALRMQKDLSLTEEQTSKMMAIDKEFGEKFQAIRKESTTARADSREKMKQLRGEYHAKTKTILTQEQFQKWEAQKSERKKKS